MYAFPLKMRVKRTRQNKITVSAGDLVWTFSPSPDFRRVLAQLEQQVAMPDSIGAVYNLAQLEFGSLITEDGGHLDLMFDNVSEVKAEYGGLWWQLGPISDEDGNYQSPPSVRVTKEELRACIAALKKC